MILSSHRGPAVVVVLLTAVMLEALRRLTGYPRLGDARGLIFMGSLAFGVSAAIVLLLVLQFHVFAD